jgi:acid phosphatase type 7
MGISRGWRPRLRVLAVFACAAALSGCGFATLGSVENSVENSAEKRERVAAASSVRPADQRDTRSAGASGDGVPNRSRVAVIVTRAIEGDTVGISSVVDGLSTVRLIGVDAPNPDQPHGDEAREFTASNLTDKEIVLEFDAAPVDRYGRLLAYAHLPDGRMFNELLVERGHAQVATFPPNTRHAGAFRDAQASAREDRLGIWGLADEDLCRQTDRGNGIGGGCPDKPPPDPGPQATPKAIVQTADTQPAEPAADIKTPEPPEAEPPPPEPTLAKAPEPEVPEPETPQPPAESTPRPLPSISPVADRTAPAATLVGAGDVADCTGPGDEATARLLSRIGGTVFTLGDNAQDAGTAGEFANCYDPSWGRFKARTKPAVGNHEYGTDGAAPYHDYFGAAAGRPGEGFYSYDRGDWHVVVLNSNCQEVGGCGPGSPQLEWLKKDLSANPSRCTLAYFHHPLFSSGRGVASGAVLPFWKVLYRRGADLVLNGHAHSYERFAPQTPSGARDPGRGIRQLVVGTGGEPAKGPLGPPAANSLVRGEATPGVLKLDLSAASYKWRFLPVAGKTFTDSGAGRCH